MPVINWTRAQLLIAFNLYCRTEFGKLHKGNCEIILLAQKIGRTPSAVAMKLVNFASLDPVQQARDIRGLSNSSRADREIWSEFYANPERLAFESQQVMEELIGKRQNTFDEEVSTPSGSTEESRIVRTRLVQGFFRDAVLSSYEFRCAICNSDLPELLTASHIIPWKINVERRADPRNGLSLCATHDRAFDRGLLTLDQSLQVVLSERLMIASSRCRLNSVAFLEVVGKPISLPKRFAPDPIAIAYHRKNIFVE